MCIRRRRTVVVGTFPNLAYDAVAQIVRERTGTGYLGVYIAVRALVAGAAAAACLLLAIICFHEVRHGAC